MVGFAGHTLVVPDPTNCMDARISTRDRNCALRKAVLGRGGESATTRGGTGVPRCSSGPHTAVMGMRFCAGMPATRQARLKRGKGGSGSCSFFFFSGGKERKRKENKTPREKAGKRELKQEQRERKKKKERDLGIQQQTKCSESPGRPRC